MLNKKTLLYILISILSLLFVLTSSAIAQEDEELEERLELIQASQNLMEEKRKVDNKKHKIATVFTIYGEGDTVINSGLRVAPQIASPAGIPLRFMGELFYLRQDEDLAAFLSLAIEPTPSIYLGAGGEVTDTADYQVFAGWNITENIFIEARGINAEGGFSESEVEPVVGFQFSF